jgi:phage host-nuclease inhibitor protein Gam
MTAVYRGEPQRVRIALKNYRDDERYAMNQTATARQSEPAFALPTEADDIADLASVGIIIPPEGSDADVEFPHEAARLDAAISETLRQLARLQLDIARYKAAQSAEQKSVASRYARLMDPLAQRAAWLESVGKQLALEAKFEGKAKSRNVAFGSYGKRTVNEHLEVTDETALLEWADKEQKDLVDVKETRRVLQSAAEAFWKRTKKVPPGCTLNPEYQNPFVKPDLGAAAELA